MDEAKFQQLMEAIQTTQKDLKTDFSAQISKLKKEVTAGQESLSQEVVKKLNKRAYQFQRIGNEAQYAFNLSIEEHIESAQKEVAKLTPANEQEKAIVTKAKNCLDEGIKAIEIRQKHIKIADRSDLGWAVVAAYEDDELASNSDDEKRIYKAEREAERLSKRKQAASLAAARGSTQATGAQEQKQLMPSLAIGAIITIGGALPV